MSAWPMFNQCVGAAWLWLLGLTSMEGAQKTLAPAPASPGRTAPSIVSTPSPPYPQAAMRDGLEGTTVVSVQFGGKGQVVSCHVVKSSGSGVLDGSTVVFIQQHWWCPKMAGRTQVLPITYKLQEAVSHPGGFGNTGLIQLLVGEGFTQVRFDRYLKTRNQVEVYVNGQRLFLILDTGSSDTVLTAQAASRAGVQVDGGPGQPRGSVTGAIKGGAHTVHPKTFTIGDRALAPSVVSTEDIRLGTIDGLLGLPALKANHAVIILNPPSLLFNPDHGASVDLDAWLKAKGCVSIPLTVTKLGYTVPVKLDGLAAGMILDTGSPLSLVNAAFLGGTLHALNRSNIPISGVDGHFRFGYMASFGQVQVGGFPLGGQMMQCAGWHSKEPAFNYGIVGLDILTEAMSIIDTSSNHLYLRAY